jgi:hypothetical protein
VRGRIRRGRIRTERTWICSSLWPSGAASLRLPCPGSWIGLPLRLRFVALVREKGRRWGWLIADSHPPPFPGQVQRASANGTQIRDPGHDVQRSCSPCAKRPHRHPPNPHPIPLPPGRGGQRHARPTLHSPPATRHSPLTPAPSYVPLLFLTRAASCAVVGGLVCPWGAAVITGSALQARRSCGACAVACLPGAAGHPGQDGLSVWPVPDPW